LLWLLYTTNFELSYLQKNDFDVLTLVTFTLGDWVKVKVSKGRMSRSQEVTGTSSVYGIK